MPDEVSVEIVNLKRMIGRTGSHLQIDEPPHITFVVNRFDDSPAFHDSLSSIAKKAKAVEIKIRGFGYLAMGKSHTLVYARVLCPDLGNLQKEIAMKTSGFRRGSMLDEYLKRNMEGHAYSPEEMSNLMNYGYPYIGRNWMPHITLAIARNRSIPEIRSMLGAVDLDKTITADRITLFEYRNGWVPAKHYKLNPRNNH